MYVVYGIICVSLLLVSVVLWFALAWLPSDVFFAFFALLAFVACAFIVVTGLKIFRMAFWLEGTVLMQRRVRRMRRCDLSTVPVTGETVAASVGGTTTPLPRIVIAAPDGEPIKLWLRNPGQRLAPLPPDQLTALAAAIEHGRADDPEVRRVTDGLRRMADDPSSVDERDLFA